LSSAFPVQNGLKQGDALLPLLFNFVFKYIIRKVQENQEGLEWKGTCQLLVGSSDVSLFDENINTMKEHRSSIRCK